MSSPDVIDESNESNDNIDVISDVVDDDCDDDDTWEAETLMMDVYDTLAPTCKPHLIDFADCMDGKLNRVNDFPRENQVYWLPPSLGDNGPNNRRHVVYPYIKNICAEAGFNVCCHSHEIRKTCRKFTHVYRFSCLYQCREKDGNNKRKKAETTTKLPMTNDCKCPFKFCVYYHTHIGRWYVKRFGAGCSTQCGHRIANTKVQLQAMPRSEEQPLALVSLGFGQ